MTFKRIVRTTCAAFVLMICVGPLAAENIEKIRILSATERQDGVIRGNFFQIEVIGTGIQAVSAHDLSTDAWYSLTYNAGKGAWMYRDEGYATMSELMSVHPNPTNYVFYFDPGPGEAIDVVQLGYARALPTDFGDITTALNGDGTLPLDPTMTWEFDGWAEIMGMKLVQLPDNVTVGEQYPADLSVDSWAVGPLEPSTRYKLEVGYWSVVAGNPLVLETLWGDEFIYTALVVDANTVYYTTAPTGEIPEPASLLLLGSGAAAMGYLARRKRKRQAMR